MDEAAPNRCEVGETARRRTSMIRHDSARRGVKKTSMKAPIASRSRKLRCLRAWRLGAMGSMARTTVIAVAVPSALERYGVGWDDEPPSRRRISR